MPGDRQQLAGNAHNSASSHTIYGLVFLATSLLAGLACPGLRLMLAALAAITPGDTAAQARSQQATCTHPTLPTR
jgi:hypothetical protein